jgi:peroxiredoxin
VTLVGISVDSAFAHKAFRDHTGIENSLLADFEPKGAVASAFGAYLEDFGHSNRSLVLIDKDGVVEWVYETETPLDIPPTDAILEAI